MNSLFSAYSQGENRVTSTIISVFERINFSILQDIFAAVQDEDPNEYSLLSFENQFTSKNTSSIPDARISGKFDFLFETKIKEGSIKMEQLKKHLENFQKNTDVQQKLFVITPDKELPVTIKMEDDFICWFNFKTLVETLYNILSPEYSRSHLISSIERYLLNELISFLENDPLNLLGDDPSDRVIVVPAHENGALLDFELYSAYICQAGRSFKPSEYIAFYNQKRILPYYGKITGCINNFYADEEKFLPEDSNLSDEEREKLNALYAKMKQKNPDDERLTSKPHKVFFLEKRDRGDFITHANGAFTQNQRYISYKTFISSTTKTTDVFLQKKDAQKK